MAEEDLGQGLNPQEKREMLEVFARTLGRRLQYSLWAIRWHKKRGRPLPPFPELFRLRDEAERRMWINLRRKWFRVIQGGKKDRPEIT